MAPDRLLNRINADQLRKERLFRLMAWTLHRRFSLSVILSTAVLIFGGCQPEVYHAPPESKEVLPQLNVDGQIISIKSVNIDGTLTRDEVLKVLEQNLPFIQKTLAKNADYGKSPSGLLKLDFQLEPSKKEAGRVTNAFSVSIEASRIKNLDRIPFVREMISKKWGFPDSAERSEITVELTIEAQADAIQL